MNDSLKPQLEQYQLSVAKALTEALPNAKSHPSHLHQAMIYSTLGAGKRVRAYLCYAAGKALGIEAPLLDSPAAAVELIHAYSLIHDDLPAMDDDDLRRGIATCHIAFGEATAILAGDALQTLAFQVLSNNKHASDQQKIKMIQCLATASGSKGMVGGQAIDIDSTGKQLDLPTLENLHIHKTGALISASVELSCLTASQISDNHKKSLLHYAHCVGLAFQVQDDILDVEVATEQLGKTSGKDAIQNKSTYPELLGLKASKKLAQELIDNALDSLESFDNNADQLRWMAQYIIKRQH